MDKMRMSAQRSAQYKTAKEKAEVKLSSLTEKLQERRTKVIELTEKNKQLKRKLERKEKQMEVSKAKEDQSKKNLLSKWRRNLFQKINY